MSRVQAHIDAIAPGVYIVGGVFIFDREDARAASRAMRQPIRLFHLPGPAPAPERPLVRRHQPRNRTRRRTPRRTRGPDDADSDPHGEDRGDAPSNPQTAPCLAITLDDLLGPIPVGAGGGPETTDGAL